MYLTPQVKKILSNYSVNYGVKTNLAKILMHGKLGGTGKLVILPVDQGFEHGPARSFAPNPEAYDPYYHFQLAIDAGLSAYAAPKGMLEAGINEFCGEIPLILKMNSANSLAPKGVADQAITASIDDAVHLGCAAVGFTIYPGSDCANEMIEEVTQLSEEAKAKGLAVVVWSYPRGEGVSKEGETALDVVAYAAHIAALMGADIIKVKPPTPMLMQPEAVKVYEKHMDKGKLESLDNRIAHVMQSAFAGRRIVVFSGGAGKDESEILNEVRQIHKGGGNGSIIGRNSFQRSRKEALDLLDKIINIYKG